MASPVLPAKHFHDEEAAYVYVEARVWPKGPVCPKCGENKRLGKLAGKSTRIGVYKCYACRKPFTVKVGTIFEDSKVPMHLWLQAMHFLCSGKKGVSANQLSRVFGVQLNTAWFMAHRIRETIREGTLARQVMPCLGKSACRLCRKVGYVNYDIAFRRPVATFRDHA